MMSKSTRGKRSAWSDNEQFEIIREAAESGESYIKLAQRLGITPTTLYYWRFKHFGRPVEGYKKSRFTDEQRRSLIQRGLDQGKALRVIAKEIGVSNFTIYKWHGRLFQSESREHFSESSTLFNAATDSD